MSRGDLYASLADFGVLISAVPDIGLGLQTMQSTVGGSEEKLSLTRGNLRIINGEIHTLHCTYDLLPLLGSSTWSVPGFSGKYASLFRQTTLGNCRCRPAGISVRRKLKGRFLGIAGFA